MKIFLLGMMGSGKSYWSKVLAQQLQLTAYDLDAMIEHNEQQSIATIFQQKGEIYFRQLETDTLKIFAEKDNFVVATGGGTPCFNNNMEWMNEHGITVWINESIKILMNRLRNEKEERPLIKDVDNNELEAFIVDKLKERKVFYLQANYIFNGKDLANDVLLNILKNVKL